MTNSTDELFDRAERLLLLPWVGGITAVLIVLTGALASFFTDDIKNHLTPYVGQHGASFSFTATGFWVCVLLVGISLSGTQWAQARASLRTRRELELRTDDLRSAISRIESLPPEDFLADYQRLLGKAVRSTVAALAAMTKREELPAGASETSDSDLGRSVRNVLGCVLELVRKYDGNSGNPEYCANVMIYRARGKPLKDQQRPYAVVAGAINHFDYDGCLELVQEYSTTTNQPEFGPDPAIAAVTLPIPKIKDDVVSLSGSRKHPVLPGAPWSYVYTQFSGFTSIRKLYDWLENSCSENGRTIEQTVDYFRNGPGKHIKSFASMPILLPPEGSDEKGKALGVLNIHSNEEGLLQEKGGERFAPLCEPFILLLAILVGVLEGPIGGYAGSSHEPVAA